ncbi:MAG TPA: hypothetical protein VM261_20320 [Kofleriaceae bacterium]|nr:hypothetical protein [Kofleriaceae bacterium]
MRPSILTCVLVAVPVVACGKVESDPDAAGPGIDSAIDGASDDATAVDAPIDSSSDGPPADAGRFPSGSYGFENLAQGNPTIPLDISGGGGATFSKPSPNPSDSSGVFLVDCNGDSGAFGFGCASGRQHIPEGMKFVVYAGLNSTRPLEFTFPQDIGAFSVAINTTDSSVRGFTLVGIDASDVDVTSATINSGAISGWRLNRVGIQRASGFRKVQIRPNAIANGVIAVDALQWTSN